MTQHMETVHLLWTGGWDSTFRLLQLLLEEKKVVQPHYLISTGRKSTGEELYTMDKIKRRLYKDFPETKERICPTVFFDTGDLPAIPRVTESLDRIRQRIPLGWQYDWIARYCMVAGLQNTELAIETGGIAYQVLHSMLSSTQEGSNQVFWIGEEHQGTDEYVLFSPYRLPIFGLKKSDMEKIARKQGWLDLLYLTWFCHEPLPNHIPCGRCNPCCFVMEEGLSRRMPWRSQFRYYATLRPLAHKDSKVYKLASQIKRRLIPR